MRHKASLDANHTEIVAALRQVGATVVDLVGNRDHALEVEDPLLPTDALKERPDEKDIAGHSQLVLAPVRHLAPPT